MLKSWKTTSAGILSIVGAIVTVIYAPRPISPEVITGALTAVLAGIGLLFAKDGNVTGGSVTQ